METSCSIAQENIINGAIATHVLSLKRLGIDPLTEESLKDLDKKIAKDLDIKEAKLENYAHVRGVRNMARTFGIMLSDSVSGSVSYKTNVIEEISSTEVDDLFHGIAIAKLHFKGFIGEEVVNNFIIGYGEGLVETDEELTENFARLKNDMFIDLQKFLIDNNILKIKVPQELYTDGLHIKDYDNFISVLEQVRDYFFKGNKFEKIKSYSGKEVPNLDLETTQEEYQAYFKMIFLANFDSVINKEFSHLITINSLQYNDLGSIAPEINGESTYKEVGGGEHNNLDSPLAPNYKYRRVFRPESTQYWNQDSHAEEGVESTNVKFAEMIINSIPAYTKTNKKLLYHLEVKDIYLLSAEIMQYELINGNKLKNAVRDSRNQGVPSSLEDFDYFTTNVSEKLLWYVNNIYEAIQGGEDHYNLRAHFSKVSNITNSLYHYFNDPNLNILQKEAVSKLSITDIIGQVISNSFGATYNISDTKKGLIIQQMYSQDFNSTGMNNTLYSKMSSNYHNPAYYDIKDPGTAAEWNALWDKASKNQMKYTARNLIETNASFFNSLWRFVQDRIGVKMSLAAFRSTIEHLEMSTGQKVEVTGYDLQSLMANFMLAANGDMNSKEFKSAMESGNASTRFDSTVGALVAESINTSFFQGLSTGFLVDSPIKTVMNVKTADGNSLPSYKQPNLTYKDTELYSQQRNYEDNEKSTFRSLLLHNEIAILGTGTKLEVINPTKGINKKASELTPSESLMFDIQTEFFDSYIRPLKQREKRSFNVIIGAYSDKSTILTKIINGDYSDTANGVRIMEQSIEDIKKIVRRQASAYYTDAMNTVFDSYNELFTTLGLFESMNLKKLDMSDVETSVATINAVLAQYKISDLIAQAQRNDIHITEELHYSRYANGTFFNQHLYDNYSIFTESNDQGKSFNRFDDFVARQEQNFIKNFKQIDSKGEGFVFNSSATIKNYLEAVNLDSDLMFKENLRKAEMSDGSLNPLLQKWMWVNALFRNEYLFISTKGEYMHPHNLREHKSSFDTSERWSENYWDSYHAETSGRLKTMSKRNVVNTSTYEAPTRNKKYGVPTLLNIASIEDLQASPYSLTGANNFRRKWIPGKTVNGIWEDGKWVTEGSQDAHDGSTWLDATYSMMVDASFPSKGYSGTKKQFGTFVSPNSVMIKKDAESVLTNAKMQESRKGDISLLNMKRKMLGIDLNDVNLDYNNTVKPRHYYRVGNNLYRIDRLTIRNDVNGKEKGNWATMRVLAKVGEKWVAQKNVEFKVNTLFDLWEAFGGQFSTDSEGNFNESSNELLYEVITETTHTPKTIRSYTAQALEAMGITDPSEQAMFMSKPTVIKGEPEEGILKSKLIHLVSNKSALKAGATNLNPVSSFSNDTKLVYSTFESRFMGPQLDASHSADNSNIKEITQIISALAQGGLTGELAREVYKDIQNIIKEESSRYLSALQGTDNHFYKVISDSFIKSVLESKDDSIAKTMIMHLRKQGIKIPFSNQNFYVEFVRSVITKMNNDFISRNYPGLGSVLVPSQGIVQLYDVPIIVDGEIQGWRQATQNDLVKEAMSAMEEIPATLKGEVRSLSENDISIDQYIESLLRPVNVTIGEVKIGDRIAYNGKEYEIVTPDDYYNFKDHVFKPLLKSKYALQSLMDLNLWPVELDLEESPAATEAKRTLLVNQFNTAHLKTKDLNKLNLHLQSLAEFLVGPGQSEQAFEQGALLGKFINDVILERKTASMTEDEASHALSVLLYLNATNVSDLESVKNAYSATLLTKILNKSRDLKPTLHTFEINGREHNVFDLKGVRYRYLLEKFIDTKTKDNIPKEDVKILGNIIKYINSITFAQTGENMSLDTVMINKNHQNVVFQFLAQWKQRDLSLLEKGFITGNVRSTTNLTSYFGIDATLTNTLEEVLEHYQTNGIKVDNLKFRPAELMVADIFRSKFGRNISDSLYEIKKRGYEYFEESLLKNYEEDNSGADIKIVTTKLNHPVYIRYTNDLKNFNDQLNIKSNMEVFGENGESGLTRYNDQGEAVYDIVDPSNVSVIMERGKEIILIRRGIDIHEDTEVRGQPITTTLKNVKLEKNVNKTIKSFGGDIKSLVPLMRDNAVMNIFTYAKNAKGESEIVEGVTEEYNLNALTLDQFQKFTGSTYDLALEKGSIFVHKQDVVKELAKKIYASWEKSHDIVSSRIPAQSMQSFMPMQVVGYTDNSKNDAYVSISQIWLQGSDFDIDKAYLMGYSFDSNGQYNNWSELTNYSTKKQLDALDTFPMPNGTHTKINPSGVNIDAEYLAIASTNFGEAELSYETLMELSSLIRKLNTKGVSSVTISEGIETEFTLEKLVNLINTHNLTPKGRSRGNALKNGVVSKINRIISSSANQLMANTPISIQNWHEAVENVRRNRRNYVREGVTELFEAIPELEKIGTTNQYSRYLNSISVNPVIYNDGEFKTNTAPEGEDASYAVLGNSVDRIEFQKFVNSDRNNKQDAIMSPYDIISYYMMQYNAAVGKDDVGIAANGIKAFFGLTDYYNNFFRYDIDRMSDNEILQSGALMQKRISFYDSKSNLVNVDINTIADIGLSDTRRNRLAQLLNINNFDSIKSNAAMILSNFLSAATDNAKELLMAEVNADKDLASMHIYLITLGMDVDQVVEFMTSEVAQDLLRIKENNIYGPKEEMMGINSSFKALREMYRGNKMALFNLDSFEDVYRGSKELTALSGLLSVNKKRKANTWELYKFLARFETLFNNSSENMFGEILSDEKVWQKAFDKANEKYQDHLEEVIKAENAGEEVPVWTETRTAKEIADAALTETKEDKLAKMVETVIEKNPLLANQIDFVVKVLKASEKIPVKDMHGNQKIVNLLTDGLDFKLYLNDDNYREIAKKYFSLVKHTFNVLEIVDSIPHYKEMIGSLALTHNMLSRASKKYNFVTTILKDVINKGHELNSNFNGKYIDDGIINKGMYFFDSVVAEKWLKTISGEFSFRVQDLMKLAGVQTYQVNISNEAKNGINKNGLKANVRTVSLGDTSFDPVISFDSAYNIAQYKQIMEDLVLPILQKISSNGFTDSLKVETVMTPFNTRGSSIVSTFPLKQLNNPVFVAQFQKLVNAFDFLDAREDTRGLIKNSYGKAVKLRDMFYIYNLIVNNERVGDKRLTTMFENYHKEPDSLGISYIEFWAKVESGEISQEDLFGDLSQESVMNKLEDNIMFHISNKQGEVGITRNGEKNFYKVLNTNFVLISDIALSREQENLNKKVYEVIKTLKSKGYIINLKC